ncbi:MAG: type II secretion system protein GspG [Candidatus Polarisedimenticolia bacterium]
MPLTPLRRVLVLVLSLIALSPALGCRSGEPSSAEQAAAAAVGGLDRARRERTMDRLEQLRTALSRYAIDHDGTVPEGSSLAGVSAELSPHYLPLLQAEDAWGNTMSYASDGRSYSVVSAGPDGETGTPDDIALRDGAVSQGS